MAPILPINENHIALPPAVASSVPNGIRKPVRTKSVDKSIVPYEDEYEKINSELQLAWTDCMDKSFYSASQDYKAVQVLMLCWDEQYDDLKVLQEVEDLERVFVDTYRFGVTKITIKNTPNRVAQTQANAAIAVWVHEHDCKGTLLLVYFAGHGSPSLQHDGSLQLNGRRVSQGDAKAWRSSVVWNNCESNLRDIQSDVLGIFDCCYSGLLGNARGPVMQAFEYLCACGSDDTTAPPGDKSFTSALIWALKELSKGSARFTTINLSKKIREAPKFPHDQEPVLSSRRADHSNERIVLHPLSNSTETGGRPTLHANGTIRDNTEQDIITLKFVFDARPSSEDIKTIGEGLNNIVHRGRLSVNRIIFGGIRPHANDAVVAAIARFKNGRKSKHSLMVEQLKNKVAAATGEIVDELHEDVKEHVQESMQQEFIAHSAKQRALRRESTT